MSVGVLVDMVMTAEQRLLVRHNLDLEKCVCYASFLACPELLPLDTPACSAACQQIGLKSETLQVLEEKKPLIPELPSVQSKTT